MAQFIKDIIAFIHTLSLVDIVLYFAVLTLIVLVISLIYIFKNNTEDIPVNKENTTDDLDLKSIVETIDENPKQLVDMTKYEEEQEEKAIISYEELLKTSPIPIKYEEEQMVDDEVQVKKVNLDSFLSNNSTKKEERTPNIEMTKTHYEHEEEFLKTLKQLCDLLN